MTSTHCRRRSSDSPLIQSSLHSAAEKGRTIVGIGSAGRLCGKVALPLAASVVGLLMLSTPAEAANEALLRLLQVLRDRGSLSAQEYDEIRKVAEAPDPPSSPEAGGGPLERRLADQEKSIAGLQAMTDGTPPPIVSRALAGKWYERISLRGYTQLRYSDVISHEGPGLEVPNDRSVNENESFVIRRGRFVFSGDLSDHLSLYAQSDFNGSTGAADFSVQMRDLYGDVWLDDRKEFRIRLGQSKVPFGWVNLQSSQNRAALERPDALNSGAEGERDLGAFFMWASSEARQRFRDLTGQGLKGSGDYGVAAIGLYSGQGLNRSDQNGDPHLVARISYPFKLASGQFFELGVQGYHGRFVTPTQSIAIGGGSVTPVQSENGVIDQRVALSGIWYPQPFGVEAEWTMGRGPELSSDSLRIGSASLQGGHVQFSYRHRDSFATWFPFVRWNYFDGARKFARNAPRTKVNEADFGLEFAHWAELELTAMYTRTFSRTRTGSYPYGLTRNANRIGLQAQWNY